MTIYVTNDHESRLKKKRTGGIKVWNWVNIWNSLRKGPQTQEDIETLVEFEPKGQLFGYSLPGCISIKEKAINVRISYIFQKKI
jgi:hypothetical protein